jgi:hypothetical protein
MASLPGMPGSRGLPSSNDPTSGSGGSDTTFDVPLDIALFPDPPVVVAKTVINEAVGSISPTTAGNTLVILTTQPGVLIPYLNSTGTRIGLDCFGIPVYDGIRFYDAAMGPRNSADALLILPPRITGYLGWEESGVYYLDSIPGGVTSIQFLLATDDPDIHPFTTNGPFFAFVYELTPAVLDVASDNMVEVETSGPGTSRATTSSGTITPSAGVSAIAFALIGIREFPTVGGGSVTPNWPEDLSGFFIAPGTVDPLWTIHSLVLDSTSGTTSLVCLLSCLQVPGPTAFFYGGAMVAFRTLTGVSGGGTGGGGGGGDLNEFLPNVWVNS